MSLAIYESVTKTIIEALSHQVVPWKKPWQHVGSVPVNAISSKPYRGVNLLLLGIHPYTDHRFLTMKQANDLGGQVRRGERSTTVIFWKRWQPGIPDDEQEPGVKRDIPLLRYFKVFNAEQCEGLSLPALYRPEPLPEHQRIELAELLVQHMPNPPSIREAGASAWYRPSDDRVQVPPLNTFRSAESFYGTLFHELGHATGHESRLNRKGVMGSIKFGSGTYGREELVAELTSAFCAAAIGLDNSMLEDSTSYINGWLSVLNDDPKAVVIAAAQAQRAADYIRGFQYQKA